MYYGPHFNSGNVCFHCVLDVGTILKVVSIPRGSWHDLEEVLLEEMTVFRVGYSLIVCITSSGYLEY